MTTYYQSLKSAEWFSLKYIYLWSLLTLAGVDITDKKKEDAGAILGDRLRQIMQDLEMPDGLSSLGYTNDDIPNLVKGTMPQVNTIVRKLLNVVDEYNWLDTNQYSFKQFSSVCWLIHVLKEIAGRMENLEVVYW